MTARRFACLAAMSFLCACGPDEAPVGESPRPAFSVIETDAFSGIASARTAAVKDEAAWATLWAEHTRDRFPPPALPAVDFSRQTIAAVFLGERPNGCHAVSVESVVREEKRIVVAYRERVPAVDAVCAAVITAPAQIVAFERSDLPVEFAGTTAPAPVLAGVLGVEATLRVGDQLTITGEELRIAFISVTNDSRCPAGVYCVWQGNAEVNLALVRTGQVQSAIILGTAGIAPYPSRASYLEYTIRLVDLQPVPVFGRPLSQSDYAARLVVIR